MNTRGFMIPNGVLDLALDAQQAVGTSWLIRRSIASNDTAWTAN